MNLIYYYYYYYYCGRCSGFSFIDLIGMEWNVNVRHHRHRVNDLLSDTNTIHTHTHSLFAVMQNEDGEMTDLVFVGYCYSIYYYYLTLV